jgi:S1-C subfamily serine protease
MQGFQSGDDIVALNGTPILSVADVQWVLNGFTAGGTESVTATVRRGEKTVSVILPTPSPKSPSDISWRASSWDLRRMTTGGMLLKSLPAEERAKLKIADGAMALFAEHVGQYGEHAAAKNAGFRKGDVVVSVDGRTDVMTETAWLTWLVNARKPGDKIPVVVLRDGKRLELTLPMQ